MVFFVVCAFGLWVNFGVLFAWLHLESDCILDYVAVRAGLTFGNVNALINLIHTFCDMQSNVVNDLARAKRRWTEKKNELLMDDQTESNAVCWFVGGKGDAGQSQSPMIFSEIPKWEHVWKRQPVERKLPKVEEEYKCLRTVLTGCMTRTNQ